MYNTLQAFNHTDIKSRDNRNHMVTPQLYAQVANMTNVKAPMSQDQKWRIREDHTTAKEHDTTNASDIRMQGRSAIKTSSQFGDNSEFDKSLINATPEPKKRGEEEK